MRVRDIHRVTNHFRFSIEWSLLLFLLPFSAFPQGTVSSTNGWTASITVAPVSIIPSTTNCQWYYNYDVQYQITVQFTGSTTNRNLSGNLYFNCTGGTGGTPYSSIGNFTSDNTLILQTTNHTRGYSAVSSYNYGSNPDCNSITTAHANCTSARLDYWGSGTIGSSITFSTGTPLPIELLYFRGVNANGVNAIEWATASEQNNDKIQLYRSFDGNEFEMIYEVQGQGNSTTVTEYAFEDVSFDETVFYQLVQIDFDGTQTKSEIIAVSQSLENEEAAIAVLPNPASDFIKIQSPTIPSSIELFDINGHLLHSLTNTSLVDIQSLRAGVYMLRIDFEGKIITKKFVKA